MANRNELIKTSEVLARLLEAKAMSIRELSRQTDIPQRTLTEWARQGSKPSDVISLKKLADFLAVSVDYLLFGVEPKPTKVEDLEGLFTLDGGMQWVRKVLSRGLFRSVRFCYHTEFYRSGETCSATTS